MLKKLIKLIINNIIAKKREIILNSSGTNISPKALLSSGEGCKFNNSVYCSDNVELGKYVSINGPGTRISARINKIKIGSFTSIASNTILQEYYHNYNRISTYYINKNINESKNNKDIYSKGSIIIGEDVWIGSNCVILSGVSVGRGSIIGAGSIVTKDVSPYSVVVGNPARKIKKRFSQDTIEILDEIKWWNWSEKKIKENIELFNYDESEIIKNKNKILSLKE